MIEAWVVCGSISPEPPFKDGEFRSGVDGYEVYIQIGNKKYKLTNKELEQFKVEE